MNQNPVGMDSRNVAFILSHNCWRKDNSNLYKQNHLKRKWLYLSWLYEDVECMHNRRVLNLYTGPLVFFAEYQCLTLRLLYINKLGKSNYPRTLLKKNLSFLIKLRGMLIRQHGITSEEMEGPNAAMDKMLSLSNTAIFVTHSHTHQP